MTPTSVDNLQFTTLGHCPVARLFYESRAGTACYKDHVLSNLARLSVGDCQDHCVRTSGQ